MVKTIMIVDQSASVRSVLSFALKGAGYNVIEAIDGEDALQRLPDLALSMVISDTDMPRLDGLSFVSKMKQIPAHRFTPVCMLTTESRQDSLQGSRLSGVKAWLIKPFAPESLLHAVSVLTR